MRFYNFTPLRDEAGIPEGGGAPAKPAEPTEVETLKQQLQSAQRERDEAKQSEKYWSERARNLRNEPDDDTPEPEPVRAPRVEKDEKLLDDLASGDGLEALRRRGLISQEDLQAELSKVAKQARADLERAQSQATFDAKLNREFPDLVEDSQRMERGQPPKTEIYTRTQALFKEMIAEDPNLRKSPAALLTAARLAKQQLDLEAKVKEATTRDKQDTRRERIEGQRGERARGGHSDDDSGDDGMTPLQRQIAKNFGLSDTEAEKVYAGAGRNGRRA